MKVLVTAKRVVDYNVNVRVLSDGSGVDLNNVKMSVNPFDEIAIEEAVRLKEAGKATEVVVVSIGPKNAQEQIRTALALGADRGILVETDIEVQPLGIAKALKAIVEKESPQLIITGKQAIDGDNAQTGQIGHGNEAGVGQFGNNHNAILTQDGNGNIAAGVQVGNGCNADVQQTGSGNVSAFVQTCP